MSEETRRLLLERIERTKARDAVEDALRWRHATLEERSETLVALLRLAEAIVRSRGFPVEKPPLPLNPLRVRRQ